MYYFISKDNLLLFLSEIGFDISGFTEFEECSLWISSNIFILLFIIFALSLVYKIVCRFFNW